MTKWGWEWLVDWCVDWFPIHPLPRTSSGKLSRAKARLDFINNNDLDKLDAATEEVRLRVAYA